MKNYSDGILKCQCCTRMKRGVHIKVYNFTQKYKCRNCGKRRIPVRSEL